MLYELKNKKRKDHIPYYKWAELSNKERDKMFLAFLDYETDMYREALNRKKRSERFTRMKNEAV